jgi:hypothetical protein
MSIISIPEEIFLFHVVPNVPCYHMNVLKLVCKKWHKILKGIKCQENHQNHHSTEGFSLFNDIKVRESISDKENSSMKYLHFLLENGCQVSCQTLKNMMNIDFELFLKCFNQSEGTLPKNYYSNICKYAVQHNIKVLSFLLSQVSIDRITLYGIASIACYEGSIEACELIRKKGYDFRESGFIKIIAQKDHIELAKWFMDNSLVPGTIPFLIRFYPLSDEMRQILLKDNEKSYKRFRVK